MMIASAHRRRAAFTLLEMSIVLVIIAVILAGGAVTFSAALQQRQIDETNSKIAAIQKALLDYRRAFHRIPCPAEITANVGDANFGTEGSSPITTCGTASYWRRIDNGNPNCTAGQPCAAAGLVPVRTLKLPDEYAFDGWGRRFLYNIDVDFAQTDAFLTGTAASSITYDVSTLGRDRLIVSSLDGVEKTNLAAYALISFGPNGHGAYGRNVTGSIFPLPRLSSGSVNTAELSNCGCDATTAVENTYLAEFYQGPYTPDAANPLNTFDDVVVYATRADLRSALE